MYSSCFTAFVLLRLKSIIFCTPELLRISVIICQKMEKAGLMHCVKSILESDSYGCGRPDEIAPASRGEPHWPPNTTCYDNLISVSWNTSSWTWLTVTV
jgi:hypothetical protein